MGTNIGGLFCYFNQAGPGNPMEPARDPTMWVTMDVGISTVPAIYDLDGDNRPDGDRRRTQRERQFFQK